MMVEAVSKWPKGGQRPKRLDFFPGLDHPNEADFRMYWYVARMEGYARAGSHQNLRSKFVMRSRLAVLFGDQGRGSGRQYCGLWSRRG